MSGLFALLFTLVLSSQKCTYTSNRISITDDSSLGDIKDEFRPIFLRLTSPGCPYSPASDDQWIKASELYPQVNFVTVDCWKNTKICSLFGTSIMTPYHSLVPANSTTPIDETQFGNNNDIQQSPQRFLDMILTYTKLYPVSPPLINLFPFITDSFYNNVDDPIFLLYDSLCSDQIPFLNAWARVANEVVIPDSDHPRVGMLDCSTYFDECQRWMRPYAPKTPVALIYSSKTGNFEVLENYNNINSDQIDGLYTNALSKPHRSMPTPVPIPKPEIVKPSTDGYTVLENTNLQDRSIETVKGQYKQAYVNPSSACEKASECGARTLNTPNQCPNILPSSEDHSKSVEIINYLRNLAGLKVNVSEDPEWSEKCYSTAINIHKISKVPSNHVIQDKYAVPGYCGTKENIQVAKDSLLSENSKSVFMSSYKYFIDEGAHNDGVVGHRRWLLHPNLNKVGFGYYPYKENEYSQPIKYFLMLPSVTVLKVIDKNVPGYIEQSVPSDLNFVSWPPAGPFPIDQLPSNWHISHPDFRSVQLKDLKIYIERDDGAELTVLRSNLPKDINLDSLVMQMTPESLKLCQPMRKITVSVFNNKNKKVYRFTFELFNRGDLTEVCLYSTEKTKCPSTVSASNSFGPGSYQAQIFSTATNQVKVHVVEPITVSSPLKFTASTRFFLAGSSINGKIQIGRNAVVDVQDPTETDFVIDWSVGTKKIGKLETAGKAKSVAVNVLEDSQSVSVHDLVFYTGKQTTFYLSSFLYHGSTKDVYYNLGGKEGNYFVSVSPIDAFQAYSTVFDNEINNRGNVILLDSIFDLSKQKTNKRVIKVYTSSIDNTAPINLSCFLPGKKRDYQFLMFGGSAYFKCDMNISKVASSILFDKNDIYPKDGQQNYLFEVYKFDPFDSRNICPMDFITINEARFGSIAISIPYVKGDNNAKAAYLPSNTFNLYPKDDYKGESTINAYPDSYDTNHKKCIITIPNNQHSNFLIYTKYESKTKHDPVIVRPAPGVESKQITLSFFDLVYEMKVPESPTSMQVYFENFQDLILDVPTYYNKKSVLPAYHFDNCGKVKFLNSQSTPTTPVDVNHNIILSDIDYGFTVSAPTVTVSESSSYDATNIQTKSLNVESKTTSTVKNIEVKEAINVDSASITLDKCTLNENIAVTIKRTEERWPSIFLVDTDINPNSVTIDLGITDSLRLLETEEYENHILIGGISNANGENKCESIKNSAQITNKGKFSVECSADKTQLIAVKGKENAPVLLPEDAITPIPVPTIEPIQPDVTETPTPVPVTETPTPVPVTETPTPVPVTETPTPVPVTETPTPVPVTETPTPVPVTETPTPVPVTETPTPVPVTETPTPVPVTETPTPVPVTETPTPVPVTETPTPVPVTETPTPVPVTETPTPVPVTETPTPKPPVVVTDTPTQKPPVVVTPSSKPSEPTKKPVDPIVTEEPSHPAESSNPEDDGSNSSGNGKSKSFSLGTIIGVVGGVVVVIIIIIVVLYVIKKRKRLYVRSSDGEDQIKEMEDINAINENKEKDENIENI
ncbi:hypothetical protein M9Y10_027598 [Tritrichomonas musculus]|uniref:SCP domain-containing protein n=1 Tax=Tritrichomonas musculus TaxID=1915356 RepID=A0ABR2H3N8_9EUKA